MRLAIAIAIAMAEIGDKLRVWREEQGLTQEDAARRIGCNQSAVSEWESGRAVPAIESAVKIADAMSVTLDALIREPPHRQAEKAAKKRSKSRNGV